MGDQQIADSFWLLVLAVALLMLWDILTNW